MRLVIFLWVSGTGALILKTVLRIDVYIHAIVLKNLKFTQIKWPFIRSLIKYTNFRGLLPMNPRQGILTLFTSVSALLFVFFSSTAFAYPTYEGCKECHQGFRDNPHISLFDETNWGDDLMDAHVSFVGGNCDACHKSGPRGEVYLNFSIDD
jgi:hypothetical protein